MRVFEMILIQVGLMLRCLEQYLRSVEDEDEACE